MAEGDIGYQSELNRRRRREMPYMRKAEVNDWDEACQGSTRSRGLQVQDYVGRTLWTSRSLPAA